MKNASRRCAFTLVELLIVCAIIAILSAILLGVFFRVRENGRSSVCQSNLHQLSLALQQYVQDNDSRFPTGAVAVDRSLSSYVKNDQVLWCPSVPWWIMRSGSYYEFPVWLTEIEWHEKYALPQGGRNEAVVGDAADLVTIRERPPVESMDSEPNATVNFSCLSEPIQKAWTTHFEGNNFAFADGHVKWLTAQQEADNTCRTLDTYPQLYRIIDPKRFYP